MVAAYLLVARGFHAIQTGVIFTAETGALLVASLAAASSNPGTKAHPPAVPLTMVTSRTIPLIVTTNPVRINFRCAKRRDSRRLRRTINVAPPPDPPTAQSG